MIEYEMKMEEFRRMNEEKMAAQAERERKR